jgi:mono/diheme cytochrome c family protein
MIKLALMFGFLCAFAPLVAGAPAPLDLHAYWDDRCHSCHGHAGDFARRTLRVESGLLVGTHHARAPALQLFLKNHYLTADLLAPVTAMLTAQATTAALFKQHCAGCHGTAAAFARESLSWRDGVLTGKKSGRAVEVTLRAHGGLAPAEAAEVVKTLARVMAEVEAK